MFGGTDNCNTDNDPMNGITTPSLSGWSGLSLPQTSDNGAHGGPVGEQTSPSISSLGSTTAQTNVAVTQQIDFPAFPLDPFKNIMSQIQQMQSQMEGMSLSEMNSQRYLGNFSTATPANIPSADGGMLELESLMHTLELHELSSSVNLPDSQSAQKAPYVEPQEWHQSVPQDIRKHLVSKLAIVLYPALNDPEALHDPRRQKIISYINKIECAFYGKAKSRTEYFKLLAEKVYAFQKHKQMGGGNGIEEDEKKPVDPNTNLRSYPSGIIAGNTGINGSVRNLSSSALYQLLMLLRRPVTTENQQAILHQLKSNPNLMATFIKQRREAAQEAARNATVSNVSTLVGRNHNLMPANPGVYTQSNTNYTESIMSSATRNQLLQVLRSPSSPEQQRQILEILRNNRSLLGAFIKHKQAMARSNSRKNIASCPGHLRH